MVTISFVVFAVAVAVAVVVVVTLRDHTNPIDCSFRFRSSVILLFL